MPAVLGGADVKRETPLKADPAKAKAWQDRSRAKAAQNAREKPRKPLARTAARERAAKPKPPVRFRAKTPARARQCERCAGQEHSRGATCHHHWLAQEFIRVYVRGLRLPEDRARRLLGALLADERNLSPLCTPCHEEHEQTTVVVFTAADVPASAHEFAAELGSEWAERLRRAYPEAA